MRTTIPLALLLLLAPGSALAQSPPGAPCGGACVPLSVRLPASTRALALGDAFVLSSREAEAVFYNPAVVDSARGIGVGMEWFRAGNSLASAAGATEWMGGGVAFGLVSLGYGAVPGRVASPSGLADDGSLAVSEQAATLAYGRGLGWARVGVAAKVVQQRVGSGHGATAAVDLGAARGVGIFTFGAAVQNLGPAIDPGSASLPTRVTLGASTSSRRLGPLDLTATAAAVHTRSEGARVGGGVELAWWPIQGRTFVGRAGGRGGEGPEEWTLGAAFLGDDVSLEYAYARLDGEAGAHRFGIRWR